MLTWLKLSAALLRGFFHFLFHVQPMTGLLSRKLRFDFLLSIQQGEAGGEIQRSSGFIRLNLVSNGCCVSPSGSALDPVPPPNPPPPLDLMSSILGEREKKRDSSPLSLACSYEKPLPPAPPQLVFRPHREPWWLKGRWLQTDRQQTCQTNSQSSRTRPETWVNQNR